jgi:hypothetical protein
LVVAGEHVPRASDRLHRNVVVVAEVLLSCATGGVPLTAPLRCTPVAAAVAGLVGGGSQASACPAGSCP